MNIKEAINQLEELRKLYGDVKVYFDCPRCGNSFEPNKIATQAVHIKAEP